MYVYWVICSFREVAPVKPAFSDSLYSLPEERGNGGGRGQTQRTRASETRFPLIRLDDYIVRRKEKKRACQGVLRIVAGPSFSKTVLIGTISD